MFYQILRAGRKANIVLYLFIIEVTLSVQTTNVRNMLIFSNVDNVLL